MASNHRTSTHRHDNQSDVRVAFEPPAFPFGIEEAVRIILPGADDPTAQLDEPSATPLANLLRKAVKTDYIKQTHCLMFPSDHGIEIIVQGIPARRSRTAPNQETLSHGTVTKQLLDAAQRFLPDGCGFEVVNVDLEPLGRQPAHVSRLGAHKNEGFESATITFNPVVRTLRALRSERDPYVYQFIVEENNGTFVGTARLVTFAPRYIKHNDRGFAEIVTNGHPRDLATIFQPTNLTSNHRLVVDDHWSVSYAPETGEPPGYKVEYADKISEPDYRYSQTEREADLLQDLVTGAVEYIRFLRASGHYHDLYSTLDVYPWFELTGPQLNLFAPLVPITYQFSPWMEVTGRDQPTIITTDVVRKADGTEQGVGSGTYASSSQESRIQNEGGQGHQTGVEADREYFAQHGDSVEIVNQDTDSLPDMRLSPTDGEILSLGFDLESELIETGILPPERLRTTDTVAAEHEEENRESGTLANAARAAINDQCVIFIFPTEQKAENAAGLLRRPFKSTSDAGATLYNWTQHISFDDGTIPLLPRHRSESTWRLTPKGTLQLLDGETILMQGPAVAHPRTFEYAGPRYRKVDGEYVIEDQDGAELETYLSKDRLQSDWTKIYIPHVPVELSYLERSIILYQVPDETMRLERYEVDPTWNKSADMTRYDEMVNSVRDDWLIEQEGGRLGLEAWRDRLRRLYRRQTDRKEPSDGKIGEVMPDLEKKQRNEPYARFYHDRTFVYPPGLISATLPGVEPEDAGRKDWPLTGEAYITGVED